MSLQLPLTRDFQRFEGMLSACTASSQLRPLLTRLYRAQLTAFREQYPHCPQGRGAPEDYGQPTPPAERPDAAALLRLLGDLQQAQYNTQPRGRASLFAGDDARALFALVNQARRPRPAPKSRVPAAAPPPNLFGW